MLLLAAQPRMHNVVGRFVEGGATIKVVIATNQLTSQPKPMSNPLQSVHVKRFKGIEDAPFDVGEINVFIGANNSGKSTLAQVIHFGVGVLQAIELAGRWSSGSRTSVSLSPSQLHYSPCADPYSLGFGGKLVEDPNSSISLSLTLADGQVVDIAIRKGRNGNIAVVVDNTAAAKTLAKLETPYTIYSPGLAGIAKSEAYISNGVLLRTIARGDANLVLRNILCRLSRLQSRTQWEDFLFDMCQLFGVIDIRVGYEELTDEHFFVEVNMGSSWVPIELAGTGVLQAAQILSYVHYFHPTVIILDEPDSHLHPNNQRLLCSLLQGVSLERDTQVFLTTHSRHVVDALSGQADFFWVRNKTAERMNQDHDLAVLVDIGALDVKEMLSQAQARCIVLTEDSIKRGLEVLLESSGIPMNETLVLSYHGCTSTHNLRPLLSLIRGSNPAAKIIVHRDRDYLTDEEATDWETEIRALASDPFLTNGVDVESHFLNAEHLAMLNSAQVTTMTDIIQRATVECEGFSIEKYVNGRSDIEKKAGTFGRLNLGQLAASAPTVVSSNASRFLHAKTVMRAVRRIYQQETGMNLRALEPSERIRVPSLVSIGQRM
jgi:ABC-type nitrate/sulfonate/bicarbonate transport system ATPase subunit